MDNINSLWNDILINLTPEISKSHFDTWIKPLSPICFVDKVLYLDSKSAFIGKLVESKYLDLIESMASNILNDDIEVRLTDRSRPDYEKIKFLDSNEQNQNSPSKTSANRSYKKIKRSNNKSYSSLNPRYIFDNFVRGKSNEFALSASIMVSQRPGTQYNPLFIYGDSGLGKTHLMQAIAHEIIKRDELSNSSDHNLNVLYIPSVNFTNEIINMISMKSLSEKEAFKKKYRDLDVLLIDDIQFIAGKFATIEEFFHIFNTLKENNKQIVISADKHPRELKNLEDRLITRFEGGLSVDIQPPDFETRVAIIQKRLQLTRTSLPEKIIELIAGREKKSIRALEGDLSKVQFVGETENIDFNNIDIEEGLEIAKNALSMMDEENKIITIDEIMYVVCDTYGIKTNELLSKNRQYQIAHPRQIAMYLCRKLTDLSLVKIGETFDRDHSTIMHGIDKIENEMQDRDFSKEISKLIERLNK